MAFDRFDNASRIAALGTALSPAAVEGSQAVFTPHHESEPYRDAVVTRDASYGAQERQRLDVFAPADKGTARPVLLFVHGGGFVAGDKKRPGTPYQDNVALWAVRNGMVGVNMTYRFAPDFTWPSGAEDVAAALDWIGANIKAHGGDPSRIFVMGTSAGAVHVASYIAHPQFHRPGMTPVGAIFLSGLYDLGSVQDPRLTNIYFGEDRSTYAERSSLDGLLTTTIPWMAVLAEHDPTDFERQALTLINRYYERHGRWPHIVRLNGHNHFTASLHLNSPDDSLGRELLAFMRRG